MRDKIKKAATLLVFWMLFAVVFAGAQRIIIPKFNKYPNVSEPKKYLDYQLLEPNCIDVLVIGASNSYTNVFPMEIYGKYGYACFSMGSPGQTVMQTYYWLQYVLTSHDVKVCIMDPTALFYDDRYEFRVKNYEEIANYYMPLCSEKIQLLDAYYDTTAEKLMGVFPLFRFHSRWNEVYSTDFKFWVNFGKTIYYGANYCTIIKPYLGFSRVQTESAIYMEDEYKRRFFTGEQAKSDRLSREWAALPISQQNREYFANIVSFCKERGIKLILVKTPDMVSWSMGKYEKLMEFMAEYKDIPVVDMLYGDYTVEINWETDSFDGGKHLNFYGGLKSTAALGKWMSENLSLEDRRGQKKYERWDRDYADYLVEKDKILKSMMTDGERIKAFFDRLNDVKEHSVILVSVRNDLSTFWNEEIQGQMTSLGFVPDFYNRRQHSYIGVIDSGNVVFDMHNKSSMIYRGTFEHNGVHSLEVKSEGYGVGDSSSVKIDGVEYSLNGVGINFVLYDKHRGTVTESAYINVTKPNFSFFSKKYVGE